ATTPGGVTNVGAPVFAPPAGSYVGAQSVTLSSTTSGASIRYTIDGSAPTSSSGLVYSGAVNVSATGTL
ncbi:MAG: chitobiase/beta-hexosaminidase C-terminal domain-containing protein, partial [Burkholderiales bacterium]|nr:chitobiase/beta-hexosaminidase C-terminal domain-containing protein [Opitutaceae bacterium]